MPLRQADPMGIRPSQVPMMQTMGPSGPPTLGAPVAAEQAAPVINKMSNAPSQTGTLSSADDLLTNFPQIGSPVTDFVTRQTIRQNAPAVDNFLSGLNRQSTLQPTASQNLAQVAPPPMAAAAQTLANRGRGFAGAPQDDMLVHMNKREVQALANASPIGGLPLNPDTGMPEAFAFLLPMVGGLAGSALGSAGLLGGMGALAGGALGSGLGSFGQGLAQGQSFGDSLLRGVVGGVASYGIGSMLQGLGAVADPVTTAAEVGNTGAAAAVSAPNLPMQAPMASAPAAQSFGGLNPSTGPIDPMFGGSATAGGYPGANTIGANIPGSVGSAPAVSTLDPGGAPALAQSVSPSFGSALKDQFSLSNLGSSASTGRMIGSMVPDVIMPPGTPQIGSDLAPRKKKYQYTKNIPEAGDTEITPAPEGYVPGRDPQHRYFRNRSFGFNEGGLVDAGIGSLDPEGEQEIIVNAKLASIGRHPNPEAALMAYAERFGVDALKKLMRGATLKPGEGEALDGPGGGMADLIPAVIDGGQPARLSSGEVVIPSDVVSGVGDGDTEAGANRFKDMMAQVRMAKTGSPQQPVPIDEAMARI